MKCWKANHLWGALLPLTLLAAVDVQAEDSSKPKILVRAAAVVKGPEITLGQIAEISATEKAHERLVTELKTLKLADAAPPRTKTSIPGARILAAIEAKGIALENILYSVPQIISVETAGRVLQAADVLPVAREQLARDATMDVQLRELKWESSQVVPTGAATYQVERLGIPAAGKVPLRIIVDVDGIPAARFMATAIVDDWREVPVLRKTLDRGMLISPSDIELVRLNLFQQPSDVADLSTEVVGRRLKSRIEAGGTLRRSQVDIPPLVTKGRKVVAVFKAGGLQASAGSVALDDGLKGETIRVRNESSKKVLKARVVTAEQVEVIIE